MRGVTVRVGTRSLAFVGLVAFTAIVALAGACGRLRVGTADKGREMDEALRRTLQSTQRPAYVSRDSEGTRLWRQTRTFYDRRKFAPAWIEDASPRPQMNALVSAIRGARGEGLDPELYSASMLEQRIQDASKGFLSRKGFDPAEAGAMD